MAYKIEYILLIGILAFLLYHLIGGCNCNDGFSVGGCEIVIDSCENKEISKKDISCDRLYEQNEWDPKKKSKCIVNTQNASNCVSVPDLCTYDPFNPTNLTPITIDYIKKNPVRWGYYINADEILIIRKSDGSQTLEMDGTGNLFILGNIYIESGATLNINNFIVNYNIFNPIALNKNSAATIINNGKLNISDLQGSDVFTGRDDLTVHICKITNNGIITFKGTNPGSINSQVSKHITSIVTYNNIDITGTGEIIYNNTGTIYNKKANIDNTQTFNMCVIEVYQRDKFNTALSFNKPLTIFESSVKFSDKDITISKITIDKSYISIMTITVKFTADNMTIKDSNINLTGQLNSKNITMDQSNLTVNNKSSINSDGIIFKNESKLIIESGGQLNSKNMTMDDTSSIISK